jgi:hypothetical protein
LFVLAIISLLIGFAAIVVLQRDVATAAAQSTVNFQARLKSGGNSVVPDGYYNVHFRLYTASSGGVPVWDERHIDENGAIAGSDNRLRTVGGYLSVSLGSITPFSSTIDWGEEMWLTIDVGGTSQVVEGSIVWDTEMSPRIKLTAVPYAFKAEQAKTLQNTNGANQSTLGWETQTAGRSILLPDEDGIVCLQTSTVCGFAPASGGTGYIQNSTIQQVGTNFTVNDTGKAGTLNATTSVQLNGTDINTAGTLTNVAYLNQVTTFKATANSATAFRVQNAAGTATVLNVDTASSVVSVGTSGVPADLDVFGNVNVAGQVVVGSLSTDSIVAGAASFDTLAATNATVQSQAVATTLTVTGNVSLASSAGTPGLLQFGVMNSVTDPITGSDGSMYFNSSLNAFRCYREGAWEGCASSGLPPVFTQGGDAFNETAVLGTNDAHGLDIIANSTTLASISSAGDIAFTPSGELRVQGDGGADLVSVDVVGGDVAFGSAGLDAQVDVNGSLSVTGSLNVTAGAATLGGALTVAGAMEISNDMFVQTADGDTALSVDAELGIVTVGATSTTGDVIVGSSITADALTLGSPAAASLTGAKLVVTTMEVQTALRLGNATSGISFNDITTGSGGGKLRSYGNSRNVRAVTLTPEYSGAVLSGTGSGTMTAGYDSAVRKNYYRWSSSSASPQVYSVVVRYTLPADWTAWSPGAGICLDAWTSSTSLGLVTLDVDGTDTLADLTAQSGTPSSSSAWANKCFALDDSQYTADGVMEITLNLSAEDAASVQIGPLRMSYLSSF